MKTVQHVSRFEFFALATLFGLSNLFFGYTQSLLEMTYTSAPFIICGALGFTMIIWLIIAPVIKKTDFFLERSAPNGKKFGLVLLIILSAYFIFSTSLELRLFGIKVHTTLLDDTPLSFLIIPLLLGVTYVASRGLFAILRTSWLCFFFIVFGLLAISLLNIKWFNIENLFPFYSMSTFDFIKLSFTSTGIFSNLLIFLLLSPLLDKKENITKIGAYSIFLTGLFYLLITITFILIFGLEEGRQSPFVLYQMSRVIEFGTFITRLEPAFFSIWVFSTMVKLSCSLWLLSFLYCRYFQIPTNKPLLFTFSIMIYALCFIPSDFLSTHTIFHYWSNNWEWIIVTGLPILLTLMISLKNRFYRHLRMFLLIFLTITLLTGCYNKREIEELSFISILGIDKGPNGMLELSAILADPSEVNKDGIDANENPSILTVECNSLIDGIHMLDGLIERKIDLEHLQMLLIGKNKAMAGIDDILQSLIRNREFRRTIEVYVVNGEAYTAIAKNKPVIKQTLSKFAQSIYLSGNETGFIHSQSLHDLILRYENPDIDIVLPMIQIIEEKKNHSSPSTNTDSDPSTSENKKKENPIIFSGLALFNHHKMVGTLNGKQTIYYNLVEGNFSNPVHLSFKDPKVSQEVISITIKQEKLSRLNVRYNNKNLSLYLEPFFEGELTEIESGYDYISYPQLSSLEKRINGLITKELYQLFTFTLNHYQVQPFTRFTAGRLQFRSYQAFKKYPFRQTYAQAKININSKFKLRRVGVIIKPLKSFPGQ